MTTKQERLKEVYDHLRSYFGIHTQIDFAESIRITRPALASAMNGNEAYLTKNLFQKICAAYPGVFDLDYLLTGKGALLTIKEEVKNEDIEKFANPPKPEIPDFIQKLFDEAVRMQTRNELLERQCEKLIGELRDAKSDNDTITDEVPATLSKLTITADTWHSGINALTGRPTAAAARTSTINVPASYIGTTGQLVASIFGICGDDYTTDVSVTASDANSQAIASVALEDVPMKKNTTTSYSGPLFTRQPTFTMTVADSWDEDITDTW